MAWQSRLDFPRPARGLALPHSLSGHGLSGHGEMQPHGCTSWVAVHLEEVAELPG